MTSLDYDSLQILRQDLMIGELHKGRVSRGNGQNTFHVGNLSVWASTTKSLGMSNMELAFSNIIYLAVPAGVVVNMVAGGSIKVLATALRQPLDGGDRHQHGTDQ